jgi:hypothetical protein
MNSGKSTAKKLSRRLSSSLSERRILNQLFVVDIVALLDLSTIYGRYAPVGVKRLPQHLRRERSSTLISTHAPGAA